MILYVDTCGLAKVYLDEDDSDACRHLIERAARIFTSVITHAEMHATFNRRRREGHWSAAEMDVAVRRFESDILSFYTLPVSYAHPRVAAVCRDHALKGADAIHVASILALAHDTASVGGARSIQVLSFDRRMQSALREESVDLALA